MSEPFLGEIRLFAGGYAPRGWMLCNGQILEIRFHTALFSLLGTNYGGNGQVTFGLPDLRGRIPMGTGQTRPFTGHPIGSENHNLTVSQMPAHGHALPVSNAPALTDSPTGNRFAGGRAYGDGPGDVELPADLLQPVGVQKPLSLMQPSLAVNFIIATQGIYPSRA